MRTLALLCLAIFAAATPARAAVEIGICAGLSQLDDVKRAGADFAEIRVREVAALSEADFAALRERLRTLGLPTPAANVFLPNDLKVVGPATDPARQLAYVQKAFDRVAALGVKVVIFGSGGARQVPEGFDRARAWDQLVDFGKRVAPEAERRGLVVAVEPLNRRECNIVNTAGEGLRLVRAIGHPAFQLMVDFYHLALEAEDPSILIEARDAIRHFHFANPIDRVYPLAAREYDYAPFFAAMQQAGLPLRLSIEANTRDLAREAPRAIAVLRGLTAWSRAQRPAPVPDEEAVFRDPPAAFRPSHFWSWNDVLDDAELRWQLRDFKAKGYGGTFAHSRVGLVTPYLSREWFDKIGVVVEESRKLGLEAWLYDEDKWPSGYAGGLLARGRPDLTGADLHTEELAPDADLAAAVAAPDTVAIFATNDKAFTRVTGAGPRPAGKLLRFFTRPWPKTPGLGGEAYTDTMNPEAMAEFFRLTFTDGYDKRFSADYGGLIPGSFTDEPRHRENQRGAVGSFPWTRRLPEEFRKRRGYDLLERLPLLGAEGPGFAEVRHDFWRTAAELFAEAFSQQYGRAMADRGLVYTGHFVNDHALGVQTDATGSVMLHLMHQQMPGIDHLNRNIANPLTQKQASSIAHQFGRPRALSELYGVTGHNVSFEELKWITDAHLVLGVNFFVPHLVLYSLTGDRKRDYPPTFSYHQPFWPAMKDLNDYSARGSYFTTRGRAAHEILLMTPLSSVWSHWRPGRTKPAQVEELETSFQGVFDELLRQHRGFDLGDEIVMEKQARVIDDELRVGPAGHYRLAILPPATRWGAPTLELLKLLLAGGGRVVAVGAQPDAAKALLAHPRALRVADAAALEAALAPLHRRPLSVKDDAGRELGAVRVLHRQAGRRHYFFLANIDFKSGHAAHLRPAWNGRALAWDLTRGAVTPLTSLEIALPPAGSFAFSLDAEVDDAPALSRGPAPGPAATAGAPPIVEELAGPFPFRRLHPNVLVLDRCRYSLDGGATSEPVPVSTVRVAAFKTAGLEAYEGMQPWVMASRGIKPDKPVAVRMSFTFASELDRPRAALVIEKMKDFAVTLNGSPVRPGRDWYFDKQFARVPVGALIKKGENRLELATTYRQNIEIEDVFLVGDFATRKTSDTDYVIVAEPARLDGGDATAQGYHFFAGNLAYRLTVDKRPGERVVLRLRDPVGTAFAIRVGGRDVARLPWRPWEADLTAALRPGKNQVEVIAIGSLQNAFGPLHNAQYAARGYDWWIGPNAFADRQHFTAAYHHAPFGIGGFELLRTAAPGR